MSYNPEMNQTPEAQPQVFVNPYPTAPVPTAPPVIISNTVPKAPRNINRNYPAYKSNPYF